MGFAYALDIYLASEGSLSWQQLEKVTKIETDEQKPQQPQKGQQRNP